MQCFILRARCDPLANLIFIECKCTRIHWFFAFVFSRSLSFVSLLSLDAQQNPTLDWRNRLPGETEQTNDEVKIENFPIFACCIKSLKIQDKRKAINKLLFCKINMQPQKYSNYLTWIVKCMENNIWFFLFFVCVCVCAPNRWHIVTPWQPIS